MSDSPAIVWFRQDLRLADQPAWSAAARLGPVIPVYLSTPDEEGPWPPGGATKWWLHRSLARLHESLTQHGLRLTIRQGAGALELLRRLVRETGATRVYWNRRYEPAIVARDAQVKASLRSDGVDAQSFNAALLLEPWEVQNKQGGPFQVFTPFYKHCLTKLPPAAPERAPKLTAPAKWPESLPLEALELEPKIPWAGGLAKAWEPGEAGAKRTLDTFLKAHVAEYLDARDEPEPDSTSRLSPYLHFGEISPRQVWQAVAGRLEGAKKPLAAAGEGWLRQIVWREFAHHLLYHFPHTPQEPLRGAYAKFPWRSAPKQLKAWQRGRTGYPLVDAGMRQLWITGWMHNRVRMVVASFLVKHLLLSWQEGAAWFWDTLVDADLANNTLGWQWTAGCGADAAPYFRIFNPVSQGEKFDVQGAYIRRWVPELAELPDKYIHQPWTAPKLILQGAGITLGKQYPAPIVEHQAARERALEALASIRSDA